MKKLGLYIHIPFCSEKCPYCDFYSLKYSDKLVDEYVTNLNKKILSYSDYYADTIYLGGGTPSILGTERIISILKNIKTSFGDCSKETTIELNPESAKFLDFKKLRYYGIDRVSIGMQSSNQTELTLLGRKHSAQDVADLANTIQKSGISNISFDLMIGISQQTIGSLEKSIEFCKNIGAKHISAYILKIEKGTAYYKNKDNLKFPDDDTVCDLYEFMAQKLSSLGYRQYEISNFAMPGCESLHNLKYWNCEEYIGIGSSAHSFVDGKRFYYGRSLKQFYSNEIINDGSGGDEEEYIAMTLRLSSGLRFENFLKRFGCPLPEHYIKNAKKLLSTNLLFLDKDGIRLSEKGFLCSNAVIVEIIS